jgi:hypothetical protein
MPKGSIPGQDNFYTHPKMEVVYSTLMDLSLVRTRGRLPLLVMLIRLTTTRKVN